MALKSRFNGAVEPFASAAIATERTLFGEVTQSDDINLQQTADYLRGWGIVGTNDLPTKQDFNALGYNSTALTAYLYQFGVAQWNAIQDYHLDSIVNVGGVLYRSIQNANVNKPPASEPTWWSLANPVGNDAGVVSITATGSILSADYGKVFIITGAGGYTLTLPATAGGTNGARATFINRSSGNVTVQRAGADTITNTDGTTVNTLVLGAGDTLILGRSSATTHGVIGGSSALRTSNDFAKSVAANGWQRLPSGLIVQWGRVTASASADVTVTFPLSFPNFVYSTPMSSTAVTGLTSTAVLVGSVASLTGFTAASYNSTTGARNAGNISWAAFGS